MKQKRLSQARTSSMQEDDIVNHLDEDKIAGHSPYFENQGDDQ